jgi:hypothetical protein
MPSTDGGDLEHALRIVAAVVHRETISAGASADLTDICSLDLTAAHRSASCDVSGNDFRVGLLVADDGTAIDLAPSWRPRSFAIALTFALDVARITPAPFPVLCSRAFGVCCPLSALSSSLAFAADGCGLALRFDHQLDGHGVLALAARACVRRLRCVRAGGSRHVGFPMMGQKRLPPAAHNLRGGSQVKRRREPMRKLKRLRVNAAGVAAKSVDEKLSPAV